MFVRGFTLRERCPECGLTFEPEQGYYLGAIYLNYAATVLVATPGFLLLDYWTDWSLTMQLSVWGGFAVGFPILCFRHSKSAWRGLDYLVTDSAADKRPGGEAER